MKDDIVIVGTGGFAREVAEVIGAINAQQKRWNLLGYLDENSATHGTTVGGHGVLGGLDWLRDHPDTGVVIGIGNPVNRAKVAGRLRDFGNQICPALVHPRAWVGERVQLGVGTVVCAGVMITCDIVIGENVILNLNTTVGHDTVLKDFASVAPSVNISGDVTLEAGSDIGTGTSIIQGCVVGEWSVVGAGAVVVRDVAANVTAVGSPARAIKERRAGWQNT